MESAIIISVVIISVCFAFYFIVKADKQLLSKSDSERLIYTLEALLHMAEDDCFQYGDNPNDDEDIISGREWVKILKEKNK